ncbi:MAG: signal recognition particle-docking protein FtsY [Spirulina sp. SIO3F2]|nr:signal recognition particle-docking protein FtsY [Spirulina sp. SIO3F2]
MPFNWFKRKKDQPDSTPATEPVAKAEPDQQQPTPAEPEPSQPAIAEDYLAWAKAAYQNVQQQQATAASSPATTAVTPDAPEDTGSSSDDATAAVQPVEETHPEPEAVESEGEVSEFEAPEVESDTVESEDKVSEFEVSEAESDEIESEVETSTPETVESEAVEPETVDITQSIETPAPAAQDKYPEVTEVSSGASTTAPDVESDAVVEASEPPESTASSAENRPAWMQRSEGLERLKETAIDEDAEEELEPLPFDDDFLWSARVLAEQGRSPDEISLEEISWLKQLRAGLGKTRRSLINQLLAVVGQGPLNDEAVEEIEALLLQADVGIAATDYIIETLQSRLLEETLPPEEAIAYLKEILCKILDDALPNPEQVALTPQDEQLNVWLMTGVNGAGKTTTVGKLANMAKKSGYTCVIAAADTFRAAAVEQVKVWGDRTDTPVIANPGKNTDPAAVVFDAIAAAQARDAQLLLVDTAGRLQNKQNLMDELAKIRRIIDKKAPGAVVESLLVLDATLGQNGLRQAEVFAKAAQLSGVVLTKLDGTAKGGVALAVSQQLKLPIRFIGAGEGIEDLRPFSSYEFVEALLS